MTGLDTHLLRGREIVEVLVEASNVEEHGEEVMFLPVERLDDKEGGPRRVLCRSKEKRHWPV
jgi:hypothetical protein